MGIDIVFDRELLGLAPADIGLRFIIGSTGRPLMPPALLMRSAAI